MMFARLDAIGSHQRDRGRCALDPEHNQAPFLWATTQCP
jgi:hypothetical protein